MDNWVPYLRVTFLLAMAYIAWIAWPYALRYPNNRFVDWLATFATVGAIFFLLGLIGDMTHTSTLAVVGTLVGFAMLLALVAVIAPLIGVIARTHRTAKRLTDSDERLPPDMLDGLARGRIYQTDEFPTKR